MNVLMVEPGKAPYETEIGDGLEAMQFIPMRIWSDLSAMRKVSSKACRLTALSEPRTAKSTILSPATSLSAVSERKTFAVSRLNLPRSSRRNSSTLKSLSGSRVRSSLSNSLYPATARPKSLKRVLSCNVDVDSGAVFADRAA